MKSVTSEPSPTTAGGPILNISLPNLATTTTPRSSVALSPSPLLQTTNPIYDYLSPRGSNPPLTKSTDVNLMTSDALKTSDSYVCLSPPADSDKRTSPDGQDDSHPVLSDDVLHHHYEYLPPLKSELNNDFESYVYMAPRNDSHLPPLNVSLPYSSELRRGTCVH